MMTEGRYSYIKHFPSYKQQQKCTGAWIYHFSTEEKTQSVGY